ncbi:PREDICTED: uncharacterized protein LOC109592598 [Amphimedon queenslandica]|uniref:Death domain-containing protein n=2 Tax=Amphimedon queenslandica TaxID=400682 RepID=A0AAN0K2K2_AMPQE|nr:PREDICTED: uncharacterized protein LOC109592598 [Amphimedon queenslandica]|eukprot:XP_019863570.1 PREDICTED: uncharacterized protein LOC109592598 [Amphimedon queenslandica]
MYPALVVSLLKEGFKMLKEQIPYRNAIKLQSTDLGVNILLVDTIQWLEIHCAGPVHDACPKLRVLVHRSVQSVSSKFSYSSNTLEGTLCQACTVTPGVCCRNKAGTSITCTNGDCLPRKIGPRQSCWFIPVEKSYEVQKSDLIKLFQDSVAHYMLIGTALDVKVDDLLPIPGTATTNLILVFQRWIDSNKEVSWRKVLQVCDDFPNELGKVKADVEVFLSSDRAPNKF